MRAEPLTPHLPLTARLPLHSWLVAKSLPGLKIVLHGYTMLSRPLRRWRLHQVHDSEVVRSSTRGYGTGIVLHIPQPKGDIPITAVSIY